MKRLNNFLLDISFHSSCSSWWKLCNISDFMAIICLCAKDVFSNFVVYVLFIFSFITICSHFVVVIFSLHVIVTFVVYNLSTRLQHECTQAHDLPGVLGRYLFRSLFSTQGSCARGIEFASHLTFGVRSGMSSNNMYVVSSHQDFTVVHIYVSLKGYECNLEGS